MATTGTHQSGSSRNGATTSRIGPRLRRQLFRIVPFSVVWFLFSLVYVLVEYGLIGDTGIYPSTRNPYDVRSALQVTPVTAAIIGTLLGAAEVFVLNRWFVRRSFWQKIAFKSFVYLVSVVVMLVGISILTNAAHLGVPLTDPRVFDGLRVFIGKFAFWSIVIYAGAVIPVSLYVSETSAYLGGTVFGNFFTGRYHRPVEEERIFMFLDMKSSTAIAEKLGHHDWFLLLNQYYADTTNPILDSWGEVYQYAGDEVIVSWDIERGLQNNNCIDCFFRIRREIEDNASYYLRQYGVVPRFKAGMHCGTVTTGEIGVLKKELFFTGDVLNTAARVQAKCNELGADLLLTEELASRLPPGGSYELESKGQFELKGKQGMTGLFTLRARARTTGEVARGDA